jgi:hypothetical protein
MSPKKIEVSASIHSTKAFDKSLILWNLQKKRKKKKKKGPDFSQQVPPG